MSPMPTVCPKFLVNVIVKILRATQLEEIPIILEVKPDKAESKKCFIQVIVKILRGTQLEEIPIILEVEPDETESKKCFIHFIYSGHLVVIRLEHQK
ncbi:hypothetical protein WN943_014868 [Citrus x changshan-huyou]